jgi:hypothetical protein
MNERNIPEFNAVEIKKLLLDHHYPDGTTNPLVIGRITRVAKLIVDYAERCGLIKPQSSMK